MRAIIPILLAVAAGAADPSPDTSLRLSLASLPKDTDFTIEASGPGGFASTSGSGTWDTAGRLSGGLYWSNGKPVSFYVGGGIALTAFDFKEAGATEELGQYGLFIEPGVKLNVNDRFAVEMGVTLGIGGANYRETGPGYTLDASGSYGELGVVVRPMLVLDKVLLFGEVGYLSNGASFSDVTIDGYPGVKVDATVDTSGAFFGIGLGLRI